jgi:O-antigen/teichoic acid export membrane protein
MNFVVLITFFASPITTMLFPAFSKLDHKKDGETLKNVFQFSVKYASLLVVPAAALVMSLSEPAVSTLFDATYSTAPLFLALLAITYVYTAFGSLSTGNLINGQGDTTFNMYMTVLTAAIGVPMGLVLILNFGVLGLIVPTLVAGLPSLFISLFWVKKRYGVTMDWVSSAKILLSSAIAAALTYILVSALSFSSAIRLVLGVVFFVLVFVAATLFTKTVDKADLKNLRGMLSALGPLSQPLNAVLNLIERLMTALKL